MIRYSMVQFSSELTQVKEVLEQHKAELVERRYTFPVGKLMGAVRERLKWADGKLVKESIEKQVSFLFSAAKHDSIVKHYGVHV